MGLREQAAVDLTAILEDTDGFGYPITVTNPSGSSASLTGFSSDVHQVIDPETGQAVTGRVASVALRTASLTAAGFTEMPRNIADSSSPPWAIEFNDIDGKAYKFKVLEALPDRALGLIVLLLEGLR